MYFVIMTQHTLAPFKLTTEAELVRLYVAVTCCKQETDCYSPLARRICEQF